MTQQRCYIGLGSNLDNPKLQLELALESIQQLPDTQLVKSSSFYTSKPQGPQDQPDFINAVCAIDTKLSPQQLLQFLQTIEQQQGRIKKRHWGERCIDLDILLYGDQCIESDDLTIPHAFMSQRDFVLLPLAEIAPELPIPGKGALTTIIEQLEESFLVTL